MALPSYIEAKRILGKKVLSSDKEKSVPKAV